MTRSPASAVLALAVLVLLALPSAMAKPAEEPVPPSPYVGIEGVTYYLAAGMVNGSRLASNPGTGDVPVDFVGCAFVQLRPELDRGRVSIAGMVDGFTPLRIEVGDFEGNAAAQGPVAANLTLDGSLLPLMPAGKTAPGEVAGTAIAEMRASEYIDYTKTPPVFVMANFTDPVGGGEELRATLAMSNGGIRDDETRALQDKVTAGDDELHVLLGSPDGAQPQDDQVHFDGPAELPNGPPTAEAQYFETYEFLNTRFGGAGTLTVSATTRAPPGFNALTFVVRAPDGSEAANTTMEWSVLAPGSATLEFPLDQMGFYSIMVTGKVLLGAYSMDVVLAAAPAFQLDFWWEDVVRGEFAQNAYGDCQREIGLRAQVVGGTVDRATPPGFPLKVLVLSIAVAAATALIVVKLVQDQVSSGEFRKQFK
jgi:hypothetical protein